MPQRASVFCNFYILVDREALRFGASVGCWKRCFQGYEYKIAITTDFSINQLITYMLIGLILHRHSATSLVLGGNYFSQFYRFPVIDYFLLK
jgi:hypothetical protein